MPIITFLAANFVPKLVPEPLRKAAAWAILITAAVAFLWTAKIMYDRSIVHDHEQERAAKSIDARDKSAEERADDAVRNLLAEKDREGAIKAAPNAGATLAPSTVAANCARLRAAYSAEELAKSDAYRELCK
jgi:hypothetical protein